MSVGQIDRNNLILFGICEDLKRFVWNIRRDNIIAVSDLRNEFYHKSFNYKVADKIIFSGQVSSIDEICKMNFDYIIVTDYHKLEEIHKTLNDKGIPDDRIVMYEYYVQCIRSHTFYSVQEEYNFIKMFQIAGFNNIIDMDLFFMDKFRYSREYVSLSFPNDMQIDAFTSNSEIRPIYNNVYRRIYKEFKDFYLKTYDVAFFSDYRSFQGYVFAFNYAKNIANNIIFRFRKNSSAYEQFLKLNISDYGKMSQVDFGNSMIVILSRFRKEDMKIYICCHKSCLLPREINLNNIYQPIQSGRKLNPPLGCIGDDTGDSISELQPYINELVVLYWIWKNTSHEYVGLCHYRRYFLSRPLNQNDTEIPILNEQQAKNILKDYDIITRYKYHERQDSIIRNQFFWITGLDIFKKSEITIRKWLKIRQPEYLPILDYVLGNTGFFSSNMFVTRKKLMDKYCEWLFSFLIDAVRDFDVGSLPNDQVRIFSYWGEIMFTVWLMNQNLKIKQMDWWMTPKEMWDLPENKN